MDQECNWGRYLYQFACFNMFILCFQDLNKYCSNKSHHNVTFLGNVETYNETAILYFLVGLVFGTSYSMTTVDVANWIVHTPWYIRFVRGAIGVGIGYCLVNANRWILSAAGAEQSQQLTEFFFDQALPYLIAGLFLFGPYVVICERIGFSWGSEFS